MTPTEAQGYQPNDGAVTDNGVPSLSDTKSFTVTVNEVNTAPVLAAIGNQTINEGATLTLPASATDADSLPILDLQSGQPSHRSEYQSASGAFI